MSTTAAAVASDASALVPFTQTFVQTSGGETVTVAYTVVGQVLDNGQTNWVGYDDGTADYLYTSSVAGAQETTIGGDAYYVSSGSAPAGFLATEAGDDATPTRGGSASETINESIAVTTEGDGSSTTSRSITTQETLRTTSGTRSGAAAETSQPSTGHRMSAGVAFALAVGIMAVFTL